MYGETIHKIRKSKNMTLKEVAGHSLSVSQLSRFENEKSMIPVDLFYKVLENLNVTTAEFEYINGQEKTDQLFELLTRVEKYNNHNETENLKELISEIEDVHPSPYSWEQFIIYFIESILETHDLRGSGWEEFENRTMKTQQPVLDYLMQVDDWGEMELRLYAIFGFVLNVETTHFLMRTALKKSKQYLEIPATKNLLSVILSNNFSTFLFNDRLDFAEETIELFEKKYAEDMETIIPHIDFIFNKGLLAYKKNMPEEGKMYCEKAISTCRLFKQKGYEKRLTKRYKSWKEKYTDPEFKELMIKFGGI